MKKYLFLSLLFTLMSCTAYKDVPYFQNAATYDSSVSAGLPDITIKPKDMLTIFVTSTDNEAVAQFNIREPRPIDEEKIAAGQVRASRSRTGLVHGYLVDNNGEIEFPVLGRIKVEGLTIEQANSMIKSKIAPYLNANADYLVNVNIDNFEVTVMGEVKNPDVFSVTRNRLTVLEALAMAGDMTVYGKRDNVKILRELTDGTYEVHELDLRDANVVNSPYYYLQQRDVVYVEPNTAMAQNASIGRTRTLWIRGIHIVISLGSLMYRVLK
ncbi:MAG: polysaccharide biosynthesis/export family protein [Prevotella sp.]|nr:polysaccharide biosynthesis/export family protein [Prevotella sp.]